MQACKVFPETEKQQEEGVYATYCHNPVSMQRFQMRIRLCVQNGDVGSTPGFDGDHVKALASIKCRALVMPAERDLYFPAADEEYEVSKMPNAELRVIPGIWGHCTGIGANKPDTDFIDKAVKEILATEGTPVTKDLSALSISA